MSPANTEFWNGCTSDSWDPSWLYHCATWLEILFYTGQCHICADMILCFKCCTQFSWFLQTPLKQNFVRHNKGQAPNNCQYSQWLWTGQPGYEAWKGQDFLFTTTSRPEQPPIKHTWKAFSLVFYFVPGYKRAPLSSAANQEIELVFG